MTFWDQATSPFNLDSEEYVRNILKVYEVSSERSLPSSSIQNERKTCREFKRVLSDEQVYIFCLLRYVMNKVRRGMDGLEKGPQLVALADILIGGLWQAFVQRRLRTVELIKLIEYHLQKWCIVFENFPIHRSYKNAVRREKKRIRMGKGRSSFHARSDQSNPRNLIRRKLLQRIDYAGYELDDEEEASKLMLGAVEERVKQLLSVMRKERNERMAYYVAENRAKYLREVLKTEVSSEHQNEEKQEQSIKPSSLQSLILNQQKSVLIKRVNNVRTRSNSNPNMMPSLDEFVKANRKVFRTNRSVGSRTFQEASSIMDGAVPIFLDEIIPYMIENKDEFRKEFRNTWIERQECRAFQRDLTETNYLIFKTQDD